MKMKLLIAALALAAGSAHAAIDKSTTGNGSLVLSVIDNVSGVSLTVDLGLNMDSFLPTSAVTSAGYTQTWDLTANPDWAGAWATYLSASGSLSDDKWVVWAVDNTDNFAGSDRVLSTSSSPLSLIDDTTNSQMTGIGGKMDIHINAVNQYGNHSIVDNGASVTYVSDLAAFGGSANAFGTTGKMGVNGSATWVAWDNVGDSLPFYLVSNSSTSSLSKVNIDTYDNVWGPSSFTLNADGTLVYTAAVPEPETFALMLAGLGLVGFIGRRRARG